MGRKGLNCLENKQKYQSSRWWTFIFTVCVKYDLIYNNEPKKLLCRRTYANMYLKTYENDPIMACNKTKMYYVSENSSLDLIHGIDKFANTLQKLEVTRFYY